MTEYLPVQDNFTWISTQNLEFGIILRIIIINDILPCQHEMKCAVAVVSRIQSQQARVISNGLLHKLGLYPVSVCLLFTLQVCDRHQ